jgi:phosphopantetheinyl transferase
MADIPVAKYQSSSLSHSRGFAAFAVAHEPTSVGIDVESLVPRDFRSMARLVFSPPEADHLDSLEDPSTLCAGFYELWTLKEAFAKALRLQLADALRQCCFIDDAGLRRAEIPTTQRWKAMVFAPRPSLRLAVVWLAASTDLLDTHVHTSEWPGHRTESWTPVLDMNSADASCILAT